LIAEKNCAGVASTHYFPGCMIDQVLMLSGEFGTAQFAAFNRRAFSCKLAQRSKSVILSRDR
jgi:hypothetical protein